MIKTNVFEIKIKLFLLKNVFLEEALREITYFIDSFLIKENLTKFHEENKFKNYCFNGLYPIEKDKVYKEDNIYTLTIRTIDKNLAQLFNFELANHYTDKIKALKSDIRIIPKKHIQKIYSITPAVLKNSNGYWKGNMSLSNFEKRVKENLIKKYNNIYEEKINEDFQLYTSIQFDNKVPIAVKYKNVSLLGDKITLEISDDSRAQTLAYLALGTGLLEMNARGLGYVNYKWI